MSPREAAYACKLLRPRYVIPMHFGTFPVLAGTPEQLQQRLAEYKLDTQVVALKPGQKIG
jgi:L-ascorbate metabolism protein UlaG (beta-lactamase superfamily)